jgi:hypothetical protein
LNLDLTKLNSIEIQLKRNKMKIGVKGIEILIVTSIIHDYGVGK